MKAPRGQKTAPNLNFHSVFLSCVKAIEEPQHRLGKIPVASCLDPWVLRKRPFACIFAALFCLHWRKTYIFTEFCGLGRATRDPKRKQATALHPCRMILSFLHLGWVGVTILGWQDPRVKGSWGKGSLDCGKSWNKKGKNYHPNTLTYPLRPPLTL